jgi:hypothetical protein
MHHHYTPKKNTKMKCYYFRRVFAVSALLAVVLLAGTHSSAQNQFGNFVNVGGVNYNGYNYYLIMMNRNGEHVKAKYFAVRDASGNVWQKYNAWQANKAIITYASGAYSTDYSDNGIPVGLTIQDGTVINRNLEDGKLDGLVIVYATGGVVATNLKEGNLVVDGNRTFNLRGNPGDLNDFMTWAQTNRATVFQTHLLAYRNHFLVSSTNSATNVAGPRRFLVVGTDANKNIIHVIVHCPEQCTLYNGARNAFDMLQARLGMTIIWMINLDTGGKNISRCYKDKNNRDDYTEFRGDVNLSEATNLIAYYIE